MADDNTPNPYAYDRARPSRALIDALRDGYGIEASETTDLGGSMNLNLQVTSSPQPCVVRVCMPYVTRQRLEDVQLVRRELIARSVPCERVVPTLGGDAWTTFDGRLVEVVRFVERDADMDSWERLEAGLPLLGRIHSVLRDVETGADAKRAPAANHVQPEDALEWTLRGTQRVRDWGPSEAEVRFADVADELARLLDVAERDTTAKLPRQLVHGDYWDNNVFFHHGRVVCVVDFDFMGERARIDDLALTLFYTNSTFSEDPTSDDRLRQLRRLVDAYDDGLDEKLTGAERAALPLAIARSVLAFVGMTALLPDEHHARYVHAASRFWDAEWALAIVRDLDRWRDAFA